MTTTTNATTVVAAPKQASSSSSSSSGKNMVPSTLHPRAYTESVGYRELKSASSLHSEPSRDRGNDMELALEPLLAYLHDHTVACSAVYSPETSSYIKLDYLKKEKNSKIILLRGESLLYADVCIAFYSQVLC